MATSRRRGHRHRCRRSTTTAALAAMLSTIASYRVANGEDSSSVVVDCVDTLNWKDVYGDNCTYYELGPNRCSYWGGQGGGQMGVANDNCCVCGGGTNVTIAANSTATTTPSITPYPSPSTSSPTISPTNIDWSQLTPGHRKFCGPKSVGGYDIALSNCSPNTECGFNLTSTHYGTDGNDCPDGLMCFANIICNKPTYDPTYYPTYYPSTSSMPSVMPTSSVQPSSGFPTYNPTEDTTSPSASPSPSAFPTNTTSPTLPFEYHVAVRGSYCGYDHEDALDACSMHTSCVDSSDCPNDEHVCFSNISCDYARDGKTGGGGMGGGVDGDVDAGASFAESGEEGGGGEEWTDVVSSASAVPEWEPKFPENNGIVGDDAYIARRRYIAVVLRASLSAVAFVVAM